MILKTTPFSIQDYKNLDNPSKKCPTLEDLLTENNNTTKKAKTVHRRRDLDSLG